MEKFTRKNFCRVKTRRGMHLVTNRCYRNENADTYRPDSGTPRPLRNELRHYGRCHQATVILYQGRDYTQEKVTDENGLPVMPALSQPVCLVDLKHGARFSLIDISTFDASPGSIIRIVPKEPIRFVNVTVRVCDLFDREVIHDQACDLHGTQEWIFVFDARRRLNPAPGNLCITIKASESPRVAEAPVVDLYELPASDLAEWALSN